MPHQSPDSSLRSAKKALCADLYADRQKFSARISWFDALHPENDDIWTNNYGEFVDRDLRVYVAGTAEYLYLRHRDIAPLARVNQVVAPKVFGKVHPEDQPLETLEGRLPYWARMAETLGMLSIVRAVSAHYRPNVHCVLFTSPQKTLLETACTPRLAVIPGPLDPRYPLSQFP